MITTVSTVHFGLALTLVAASAFGEPQSSQVADDGGGVGDIIVRAKPGPPHAQPTTIDYFRKHCFDPNRLHGAALSPESDLDWEPTSDDIRARLKITDPATVSFMLAADGEGRTLIFKTEQINTEPPHAKIKLTEDRCTFVVLGGKAHKELLNPISKMFRGPGTQRHVGYSAGIPKADGWQQWLWSVIPAIGSKNWDVYRSRTRRDTFVVVTNWNYYEQFEYVFGDLKIRTDAGRMVSILTLGHIYRTPTRKRETNHVTGFMPPKKSNVSARTQPYS